MQPFWWLIEVNDKYCLTIGLLTEEIKNINFLLFITFSQKYS